MQPAVDRVHPTLSTAWKHGKHYSQQGHSHALKAYGATKARTLAAWESAQPTLNSLAAQSKVSLLHFAFHILQLLPPIELRLACDECRSMQALL